MGSNRGASVDLSETIELKLEAVRRRVVIQFEFYPGSRRTRTYWLLMPTEASIRLKHPGFEIDVTVSADLATLYQV